MTKLGDRLTFVAKQIRSATHADIGSDHGKLLVALLQCGRIDFGIAIENKRQPFDNSLNALAGLPADIRLGDGLAALGPGEADSLSICGMGAEKMRKVLEAFPERVPDHAVLQPNTKPEIVRDWALRNGFHLLDEYARWGNNCYTIMSFQRVRNVAAQAGLIIDDPAYENVDVQAALLFGPMLLKRNDQCLIHRLIEEQEYWSGIKRLNSFQVRRLKAIRRVLSQSETPHQANAD